MQDEGLLPFAGSESRSQKAEGEDDELTHEAIWILSQRLRTVPRSTGLAAKSLPCSPGWEASFVDLLFGSL